MDGREGFSVLMLGNTELWQLVNSFTNAGTSGWSALISWRHHRELRWTQLYGLPVSPCWKNNKRLVSEGLLLFGTEFDSHTHTHILAMSAHLICWIPVQLLYPHTVLEIVKFCSETKQLPFKKKTKKKNNNFNTMNLPKHICPIGYRCMVHLPTWMVAVYGKCRQI